MSKFPADWPVAGRIDLAVHDLPHRSSTTEWWYLHAHVETEADLFYTDFVERVAQGRKMTVEVVDAIARGRVWTGADALEHGLVDELRLMVYPFVLGAGERLFGETSDKKSIRPLYARTVGDLAHLIYESVGK